MDISTALKIDLEPSNRRFEKLAGVAEQRLRQSQRFGYQLYTSVLSDTQSSEILGNECDRDGLARWDRWWAAATLEQLKLEANKQASPRAILFSGHPPNRIPILRESALSWLSDRGGAVCIDFDLIRAIHPAWHYCMGHEVAAELISRRTRQLAGMLLTETCQRRFHIVLSSEPGSDALVGTLICLVDAGYRLSVFTSPQTDGQFANVFQVFRKAHGDLSNVEVCPIDSGNSGSIENAGRSDDAASRTKTGQTRRLVLVGFGGNPAAESSPQASPTPAPVKNVIAEDIPDEYSTTPQPIERVKEPKPTPSPAPVKPEASAPNEARPNTDGGAARRRAIQNRIRKKADG